MTTVLTPNHATERSVAWSTYDASVATVDANGLVTAVGAGVTEIMATTADGKQSAASVVTVTGGAAVGAPGKPNLSDDNGHDTGLLDGSYQVKMNLWWGNNGTLYKLYENDVLIDTQTLSDRSPDAQSAVTAITYKANGTYRYVAELTNAFGTTRSDVLTVHVRDASPGKPVLSDNNWDGDGSFNIGMNMWWGTNGSEYRLYENGVLIDTQTLAERPPQAQSAVTGIQGRQAGVYEYRSEWVNHAGITSSHTLVVTVRQ